ncbi:hypothetical protein DVH24_028318 [Malus domestica]|uniref:Uncharacterized protein n=1 Tax=Malus domestica TaxID=3750 RepID=A0A498HGA3_MALDO|nr:hypothetical protein DVH24_028318 [Malus domestica]
MAMPELKEEEGEAMFQGQHGLEMCIADIINSEGQGQLITLSQIAAKIASPTTNLDHLCGF